MAATPPFNAFYFDCDSTLSAIEGVDELATFVPEQLRREILALTEQAMEGTLPLAEVYEGRLHRLAPSRKACEKLGQLYIENLVPGAEVAVAALQSLDKEVGVISGGFEIPVRILAKHLNIPENRVHAVPLLFDESGHYRDFDRSSPLWKNAGKVEVLAALPRTQRPVLYLGDGVTDLEAQGTVDLFVGFGGVAVREAVKRNAEAWVENLERVLALGLTQSERELLRDDDRFSGLTLD